MANENTKKIRFLPHAFGCENFKFKLKISLKISYEQSTLKNPIRSQNVLHILLFVLRVQRY